MRRKIRLSITIIVILIVIFLSIILLQKPNPTVSEGSSKCIGKNSKLYVQLGCHACNIQKNLFGENYKYLKVVDCLFEQELCKEKQIEATPTWIINEKEYRGVQSIEKLQELTGC